MSGFTAQAWQAKRDTHPKPSGRPSPAEISSSGRRGMLIAAAVVMLLLALAGAMIADGVAPSLGLGGVAIVFGGVTISAFMTFRPEDVLAALGSIAAPPGDSIVEANINLRNDMEDIVGWARIVCGHGLRALELSTADIAARDAFVTYGLNLVVSDYAPEDVRAMLHIAAEGSYERERDKVDVLSTMAGHAPAFGMVGTLIGMISSLHDINGAAGATGGMLAVAFLSTLYGILSARMIYMPAAARLERQVDARRLRDSMVTEGMAMLAARKPGTVIRDRLSAYLHAETRAGGGISGAAARAPGQSSTAPRPLPRPSLTVIEE